MALLLAACGGGGSSQGSGTPPSTNQPPVFSSATATSVVENVASPVYQALASDPNGDALTYSVVGGADAARFNLTSAGQLSFATPPNFDLPTDADGNNVYEVQIGASDGKVSTGLTLLVTVTNSKEGVAVHRVGTGFTNPVAIAPVNATTVLVAEKGGNVYVLNPQTGSKTLLLQLTSLSSIGMVALSASPTYESDGLFLVMYHQQNGYLILERYVPSSGGHAVPEAGGLLFAIDAPQYAGGGWLGFDASGAPFAATGDAGGNGDPTGSAQTDGLLLGKLMRIVPNPDPYAGASPHFFLASVVAKGLHRPNGGSAFGNNILLADHGQDIAEELDLQPSGATAINFGWPFKEGTRTTGGSVPAGLSDPVLEYYRSTGLRTGQAIIGGGPGPSGVASLRNQYVFADGGGAIFAINAASLVAGTTRLADSIERRDADFAPDAGAINHPVAITAGPDGTLFIVDASGDVFRVDGS